jgi:hypothetical protein
MMVYREYQVAMEHLVLEVNQERLVVAYQACQVFQEIKVIQEFRETEVVTDKEAYLEHQADRDKKDNLVNLDLVHNQRKKVQKELLAIMVTRADQDRKVDQGLMEILDFLD